MLSDVEEPEDEVLSDAPAVEIGRGHASNGTLGTLFDSDGAAGVASPPVGVSRPFSGFGGLASLDKEVADWLQGALPNSTSWRDVWPRVAEKRAREREESYFRPLVLRRGGSYIVDNKDRLIRVFVTV